MSEILVSRSEVIEAFRNNDRKKIVKILEDFGFSKTEPVLFTEESRALALLVLVQASAAAGRLSDGIFSDLIDYLSLSVDAFNFAQAIDMKYRMDDLCLDSDSRATFEKLKQLSANVADAGPAVHNQVTELSRALVTSSWTIALAFCNYLASGEVQEASAYISQILIRHIYDYWMPSRDWFFACMAACLQTPIVPHVIITSGSDLAGLAAFLDN